MDMGLAAASEDMGHLIWGRMARNKLYAALGAWPAANWQMMVHTAFYGVVSNWGIEAEWVWRVD